MFALIQDSQGLKYGGPHRRIARSFKTWRLKKVGSLKVRVDLNRTEGDERDLDALLAAVLEFGARRSAEDHAA